MLSPHDRTALFDALRPPPGFGLDHAVGMSFTLDLEALLTAPIAFALFDSREADPTAEHMEPVGLLEAIRRYAERFTMFCQAGQIAVPARSRTVFAWLEDVVCEVPAPRPHRIFHPKVWLTRYKATRGDERVLRLLCSTRNLTFDTSWDTLLRLESEAYANAPSVPAGGQLPVAELVRRLPDIAVPGVGEQRRAVLESLADDLASVPLAAPEPFDELRLHVLGLDGAGSDLFPAGAARSLVGSPFLSPQWLEWFVTTYGSATLVSREESLDRVPPAVLAKFGRTAVLNPRVDLAAEPQPDPESGTALAAQTVETTEFARPFGGLHAKLFVFDTAEGAVVLTGSANATEAAFNGNIEVVAELRGPGSAGTRRLLGETLEKGFNDLLVDYVIPDEPVETSEAERLQRDLDELRRRLAGLRFTATVQPSDDHYELTLTTDEPVPAMYDGEVEVTVRPVTLVNEQASSALALGETARASFAVTLEGISAFFVLTATAVRGSETARTTFVTTARLSGAPADRGSRLLAAMLRDPDRLLRYMLLLLADTDPLWSEGAGDSPARWVGRWAAGRWEDMPLLELLVRAADRFPGRLEHIQGLLRDLGEQSDSVLPPGFHEVWEPIWRFHRDGEAVE